MSDSICDGRVVFYNYALKNSEGKVVEENYGAPFAYVHSKKHRIIAGVFRALEGHRTGDRFQLRVPPAGAYGSRDASLVKSLHINGTGRLFAGYKPGQAFD